MVRADPHLRQRHQTEECQCQQRILTRWTVGEPGCEPRTAKGKHERHEDRRLFQRVDKGLHILPISSGGCGLTAQESMPAAAVRQTARRTDCRNGCLSGQRTGGLAGRGVGCGTEVAPRTEVTP